MHRHLRSLAIFAFVLGVAVHSPAAGESPVVLPEFRVEGTPWLYARMGDMEILSRASPGRARQLAAALVRGRRLYPDFFTRDRRLPLLLIVADSPRRTVSGLKPAVMVEADERQWPRNYQEVSEGHDLADEKLAVIAINLGAVNNLWLVLSSWSKRIVLTQRPAFPEWVTAGLFGESGAVSSVIGRPQSTTVRFPRLSWPDPAVSPGEFPQAAADFPVFAEMFDSARKADVMSPKEKTKFQFQTAFFARWSLFGPAKNGRNRNGYWAFAEMARRGQATEAVFRECYGMDWAQSCAEMRTYLKRKHVGLIDVQMPHVMADVPEAERLKFRDATLEEVRRILGDFNRLRAAEAERGKAAKAPDTTAPTRP
ncbi:MAG: hypothetical protein HYV95_16020 [Opitutae bacterium]|nr:hypothetical protein [Opitutae bacterium]